MGSLLWRGIVNPPDDLNLANPPSNAALLDHLAKEFIAHNFDLQWLHRTIIASDTYQRSWETNETNIHDRRNFSRFVPRRLPAEVLYDAMLIATSNDSRQEKLTSERKGRAVNVTDFDQRRSNAPYSYALGVFGRSTRESNCDCDRSEEPSLLQTVFLRNDKEVLQNLTSETGWVKQVAGIAKSSDKASADLVAAEKLEKALESYRKQMDKAAKDKGADKKKLAELKERMAQAERRLQAMQPAVEAAAGGKQMSDEELTKVVQSAFLRSVSREPNPEEISRSLAFIRNSKTPAEGIEGVMWALINTKEFSLNH